MWPLLDLVSEEDEESKEFFLRKMKELKELDEMERDLQEGVQQ